MSTTTRPAETHHAHAYRYQGDEGELCLAEWCEFEEWAGDFVLSFSTDFLKEGVSGDLGLPAKQARALAERILSIVNEHSLDPRPSAGCPSWCTFHRPDCEDCHYGKVTVNEIEVEIQLEPEWDEPRVDVGGYDWVNGPELTDLAEALHVAERMLGIKQRDEGIDCD